MVNRCPRKTQESANGLLLPHTLQAVGRNNRICDSFQGGHITERGPSQRHKGRLAMATPGTSCIGVAVNTPRADVLAAAELPAGAAIPIGGDSAFTGWVLLLASPAFPRAAASACLEWAQGRSRGRLSPSGSQLKSHRVSFQTTYE